VTPATEPCTNRLGLPVSSSITARIGRINKKTTCASASLSTHPKALKPLSIALGLHVGLSSPPTYMSNSG